MGQYLAGHTILQSHAKAYRIYEREFKSTQGGKCGITMNSNWNEASITIDPDFIQARVGLRVVNGLPQLAVKNCKIL